MKTESIPSDGPPTPPTNGASTSPTTATAPLDDAPRGKKAGVGPVRTRAAPSKTFVCRGFGDCSMVFSRSEHLARHVRKHTGERPFACHCGKQFSRLDNLRQHAQTVHSDKSDLNERMMRDLTSLHTALAATSHRNLPRLSPSQPSRSQPSTPNEASGVVPSMAYENWRRGDYQQEPFLAPSTGMPLNFTLTLPDGTASDFLLPTPAMTGPFSAPILGENQPTWVNGPWTMAEGVSPLRAEAAQGVGSLRSRPSSPGANHNPYFPPLSDHQLPEVSPGSDGLPHRPAGRPSIDRLLPAPRQPLHHSASDPQLHHARARAAASIGPGMYSPLSRQPWLPHDIEMTMIDRPMEIGMLSHLDSGLGLHPRPPSTERDADESGSGSDPGIDATSRMDPTLEMIPDMIPTDLALDRMSIPTDWPPLAMLLHPPPAPPRWSSDVESLEAFTPETAENPDYYRPQEDTTRHFPGIRQDSLPANAPMTLGLEMPDPTRDHPLADLRSWNYAQPNPMVPLHSAFRPMASPPLSGGGSPRPSLDLRLSAAGISAGYQGLPPSGIEHGRMRYMSEPGLSRERFHPSSTGEARYLRHPLHPQQQWDPGMMTIENPDGIMMDPAPPQDGERAYPTPLSAHPRLPGTGENAGSANGSEVKFEYPSPRLLPLPE